MSVMASIASKLNLYSATDRPEREQERLTGNDVLTFGSIRLRRLSDGFYRKQDKLENPTFGKRNFKEFVPLHLSSILELSLLNSNEMIHPDEILFLDTETTGISRGTGTIPFLTGLAFFEGNSIQIEQVFLEGMEGEEAYLDYLSDKFKQFPYLVSYNGKSFDIPILRNRFILNRKRTHSPLHHFDLLHILKRLVRKEVQSGYRQSMMEQFFFDFNRTDDIPGKDVPQIYFDYKKYGVITQFDKIFEHNHLDMLGMVFLFLESIAIYENRGADSDVFRSGIARILIKNRKNREAIHLLTQNKPHDISSHKLTEKGKATLKYKDYLLLAVLYRSEGEFEKSAEIFDTIVKLYECPYSVMALARLYEHKLKELTKALEYVEFLLEKQHASPNGKLMYSREDLMKRKERILKKINRSRSHESEPVS